MSRPENPFERYDLDPSLGPKAITERLRELAEDASPAERDVIRAAWEELTLHPLRRLAAAFDAHPATRPAMPLAPDPPARPEADVDPPRSLWELAVLPPVTRALGGEAPAPPALTTFEDDPLIRSTRDVR